MKKIIDIPDGCEQVECTMFAAGLGIIKVESLEDYKEEPELNKVDKKKESEFKYISEQMSLQSLKEAFVMLSMNLQKIKNKEPKTACGRMLGEFLKYILENKKDIYNKIEYKNSNGWCRITSYETISLFIYSIILSDDLYNYRIKPKPQYKPWDDESAPDSFIDENGRTYGKYYDGAKWWYLHLYDDGCYNIISFNDAFEDYKQQDGSPCGVMINGN